MVNTVAMEDNILPIVSYHLQITVPSKLYDRLSFGIDNCPIRDPSPKVSFQFKKRKSVVRHQFDSWQKQSSTATQADEEKKLQRTSRKTNNLLEIRYVR
jgi:hypothetical protein